MKSYLSVLKSEFSAEEGSFLLQLRRDLEWSKASFLRLVSAMQNYVEADPERANIERWVAEGFWYLDHFVKDWSSHPNFKRPYDPGYYEQAYERLHDLAHWLFVGESPYKDVPMEPFDG